MGSELNGAGCHRWRVRAAVPNHVQSLQVPPDRKKSWDMRWSGRNTAGIGRRQGPMLYTSEEIRRKYDSFAGWYDLLVSVPERILGVGRLRRRLLSRSQGKVLEVGVGTGRSLRYYPAGLQVMAGDISYRMLQIALRRAGKLPVSVRLFETNAEDLNFSDHHFDTVVSTLTLCTFPNPEKVLREFSRVCRPNGRILLLEHGRSAAGLLARWQDRTAERHARTLGCYWNREPLELVQRAGLTVIQNSRHVFGIFHLIEATPAAQ